MGGKSIRPLFRRLRTKDWPRPVRVRSGTLCRMFHKSLPRHDHPHPNKITEELNGRAGPACGAQTFHPTPRSYG